jgi:hypothetical protein
VATDELVDNPDNENDDFGDFEAVSPEPRVVSALAVESIAEPARTHDEDEFGDFAAFANDAVPSNEAAAGDSIEPSDASWDDFKGPAEPAPSQVAATATASQALEKEKLLAVRKLLVDLSSRLPEEIRRQKDGGVADFGRCLEDNLAIDVPVSEERKRRTQSCLLLLHRLTGEPSSSRLASAFWGGALSVALAELSAGVPLLEEALQFSEAELAMCRSKLETFVHGLGEYVRVSRSVTATVGDLLMLETSYPFTSETLAGAWCNLALLDAAQSIEKSWEEVEGLAGRLRLASKQATAHRLETVEEIRRSSAGSGREGHSWCEFTLQPLVPRGSRGSSTKAPVEWDRRPYMACAANFLQSKCPSYSAGP